MFDLSQCTFHEAKASATKRTTQLNFFKFCLNKRALKAQLTPHEICGFENTSI